MSDCVRRPDGRGDSGASDPMVAREELVTARASRGEDRMSTAIASSGSELSASVSSKLHSSVVDGWTDALRKRKHPEIFLRKSEVGS